MASCTRCGSFLCGPCTEVLSEAAYCADCLALLNKGAMPPRVVKGFLALNVIALASFPLCMVFPPAFNLVVAVLGLWAATRELRRLREGHGALRGTWLARTLFGLGVVNGLLVLAWVLVFGTLMGRNL